ncbi:odorant receptor Or1-like [Tribolium madens]|uniref:odorant receptor Or1-like n=1 Tax=Tribolium madens TaxID=41895 RepID=UPI001CF75D6F|nr:odorant receptor Or1-like [Tribolium madens]
MAVGLKEFDWTTTISTNLFMLKCVGLWPEAEFYKANIYTCYAIFNAIFIIGGHNLSQLILIYFVYSDLEALANTVFVLTTNIMAAAKMYFFVRNLKMIKQMLAVLSSPEFLPKSGAQLDLVQPSLSLWKLSYTVFSVIVAMNVFLWSIAPCFNEEQRFPFVAWYPFQTNSMLNYCIVYLYQVVCIWVITIANLNMDTMTMALMVYIGTQCDILCDNLKNLCGSSDYFNTQLINCVKHHKKIVNYAKESNNIFNMIILGQFATSTMVLALTMFQLSLVNPLSGIAAIHLNYILGITTEILLYCYYGNEVEVKSNRISYSIYKSDWYQQPVTIRRIILILCERCKRPIKITAINLFALSLSTFMTIIRSAYSYFALLYNVNNR